MIDTTKWNLFSKNKPPNDGSSRQTRDELLSQPDRDERSRNSCRLVSRWLPRNSLPKRQIQSIHTKPSARFVQRLSTKQKLETAAPLCPPVYGTPNTPISSLSLDPSMFPDEQEITLDRPDMCIHHRWSPNAFQTFDYPNQQPL
ncbi:hypothetical protein THARTR1_09832 [Trichoderma harzianum]|uniref:Uncharacterized protein n=1 Tax=Trichoderma harzianum TaxID=5544 RepID=A0A2K0TVF7_TRIHA|nr:hypothetical protein THARTR1_09832 [Trichoderma harzianum]